MHSGLPGLIQGINQVEVKEYQRKRASSSQLNSIFSPRSKKVTLLRNRVPRYATLESTLYQSR